MDEYNENHIFDDRHNNTEDEQNDYQLPDITIKPLPYQVDDSVINKSNLLKIYSSNDVNFLNKLIGHLTKEEDLIAKKLIITMIGKKKGWFNDKAVGIITDETFFTGIINGQIDIDRLKMMLKFEMDPRVDNSFETRADSMYIKFEEFDKLIDASVENFERSNQELKNENMKLNKLISHYKDRLPINGEFLSLEEKSEYAFVNRCLSITSNNISKIKFEERHKIIDYVFDYQFIIVLINQLISETDIRFEMLSSIRSFLVSLDVNSIIFNEDSDPVYRTLPEKVNSLISMIDHLLEQ